MSQTCKIQLQHTCRRCYVATSFLLILTLSTMHSPQDFSGFREYTALYTYIYHSLLIQSTYCMLVPTTILCSKCNLPVRQDAKRGSSTRESWTNPLCEHVSFPAGNFDSTQAFLIFFTSTTRRGNNFCKGF